MKLKSLNVNNIGGNQMVTGYKFPYKDVATDIADIAAPGYANTLAPCVYFGKAGYKTGTNDNNKFLAVNDDDP